MRTGIMLTPRDMPLRNARKLRTNVIMHSSLLLSNTTKKYGLSLRNSLAGRSGVDWMDSSTCRESGIPVTCEIRLVILDIKRGCHSFPNATSWTKNVQSKMLEQTRTNQTCKRVLGITGAGSLSDLTCIPSDLTSIAPLNTTLLPHSKNRPIQPIPTFKISILDLKISRFASPFRDWSPLSTQEQGRTAYK